MIDNAAKKALLIAKQGAPRMDFYDAGTYTPPVVPPRPIAEDYKKGVPLDDRGNLSRTIEGRPLTAQVVAGRSTLGDPGVYPDRGIDPKTLERLGTEAGGASFLEAAPRALKAGASGELEAWRDPETGNRRSVVRTRNDLSPEGGDNVRAHEVAHLFDWISRDLPVPSKGPVRDQMEQVYHHLATGKAPEPGREMKYGLVTPEAHGYSGKKADKELAAESIRAYLTNPNYLKTAAPKAAALIRNHFNDHPYLSKFLQFNSAALALLGSSGMYADGGMVDEDAPDHPDITKASGGMIDDPAKAIRRAVLVAKGLSRAIGPMPGKDEGERVHPASLLPGVHVQAIEPQNFAGGGEVQPTDETGFDAFHGTPHKFEPEPGAPLGRFRSDKIGTGEGAQAFGHGLYVGEEGTARGYRDKLRSSAADSEYMSGVRRALASFEEDKRKAHDDALLLALTSDSHVQLPEEPMGADAAPNVRAAGRIFSAHDTNEPANKVASNIQAQFPHLRDEGSFLQIGPKRLAIADQVEKMRERTKGHIYHVRVNANPEHFLDWDKPLSEQHPHVKRALGYRSEQELSILENRINELMNAGAVEDFDHEHGFTGAPPRAPHLAPEFHQLLNERAIANGFDGRKSVEKLVKETPNRAETSAALHAAGIPGIRYLDANSRGPTGNPTHNHVIFDPSIIDIKRRYKRGGGVQGYREGGAPSNVSNYQDLPSKKMTGFDWRPLSKVHEELGGMSEIPSHVADFGKFMDDTARRASTQGLSPRDLIKAYTITRSSIQRESRTADKARAAGLILPPGFTGDVRPEGAFGEWLHSPMGQRYLDAAERGRVDHEAVADASKIMKPFGLATEAHALPWAAENLPQHAAPVSDMVSRAMQNKSTPEEWRGFIKGVHGIGNAKAGFMASLLGRGDQPTLDARQVILHTGRPTSEAKAPLARAGSESVDRLASRQQAMAFKTPEELAPYYQHLAHHSVWDEVGNQQTTHQDVINAMQHAATGGTIHPAHEHPLARAMREIGMPGLDGHYDNIDHALSVVRSHKPHRR